MTEAERDDLQAQCWIDSDVEPPEWAGFLNDIVAVVEAILAARLAPVEALVSEALSKPGVTILIDPHALREALAPVEPESVSTISTLEHR